MINHIAIFVCQIIAAYHLGGLIKYYHPDWTQKKMILRGWLIWFSIVLAVEMTAGFINATFQLK